MDFNTDGRYVQPQISIDRLNEIQEFKLPNQIKLPTNDAKQKGEVYTSTTNNSQ